jgi:hypothetical protein
MPAGHHISYQAIALFSLMICRISTLSKLGDRSSSLDTLRRTEVWGKSREEGFSKFFLVDSCIKSGLGSSFTRSQNRL